MSRNILIVPNRAGPGNPNIQFSGSSTNSINLEVLESGSVQFVGSSGSLLSIVDRLSGSLFAVSDISGMPILEVFSDDKIVAGTFNKNTLFVSGTRVGIGTSVLNDFFVVSGSSTFSGTTKHNAGLSGSLTRLVDGTSYIIAGSNVTVTTGSNGAITIASTGGGGGGGGGDPGAQYLTLAATASLSAERVFTPGTGLSAVDGGAGGNYTLSINDSVVATVSGTTFTGVTKHNAGLSGSLTRLTDGTSYIIAGSNVTVTSASNGAITIASTGGSGGSGDPGASYVVLSATASLSNERVLTAGTGISLTDGGAGSTLTITATGGGSNSLFYPSQNSATYSRTNFSNSVVVTSSSWQTINELTASITTDGGAVLITSQLTAKTSDTTTIAAFTLLRNGTDLSNATGGFQYIKSDNSTSEEPNTISITYIDPVSSGTHAYAIAGKIVEGSGNATIGVKSTGLATGSLCQICVVEMPTNASYVTSSTVTEYELPISTFAGVPGLSGTFTSTSGQALILSNIVTKGMSSVPVSIPMLTLYRDSTNLGNASYGMVIPVFNTSGSLRPSSITYLDITSAGTYTYSIRGAYIAGYATGRVAPNAGATQCRNWIGIIDPRSLAGRQTTSTTSTNTNASFTEHSTLKHTITTAGRPVLIGATIDYNPTVASARAAFSIFRDGVNLGGTVDGMALASSYGVNSNNTGVTILYVDTPPMGTYSYSVGSYNVTGSGQFSEVAEVANIYTYEFGPTAPSATGWIDNGNTLRTTASVAIDSSGARATEKGQDVFFWVSGSISGSGTNDKKSVFGGDVVVSGSVRIKSPSTTDAFDRIVWELDDTTWSIASSGVTGTLAPLSGAAVVSVPGIVNEGRALDFATADSYLTGSGTIYFTGSQLSVSVWFRPAVINTGAYQLLAMKAYSNTWSNPFIAWAMYIYPNDAVYSAECQVATAGAYTVANTRLGVIKRGTWNNMVLTYDGAYIRCYINGVEEGNAVKTGNVDYGSAGHYYVGKNPLASNYQFSGSIDQIKVMNTVRTPDEIRRAYSKEIMKYYFMG